MSFEWTPEFWQAWRESANPYRFFKSERDRRLTAEALDLKDGDRVLEIGCGYGWISEALFRKARIRWTGLDRSESMVKQSRAALEKHNPNILIGDGCHLPFPTNSFDKVLCTGVLMHISDEFAALSEMVRVLSPGGLLVCSMNNALSPYSPAVRLHNSSKSGFVQNFHLPSTYRSELLALGVEVRRIQGDGIVITVPITVGRFSFPPRWAFRILRNVDQWMVRQMPWLAYEVWFTGIKNGE